MKKLFSKRLLSILVAISFVFICFATISCSSTKNTSSSASQISDLDLQVINSDPAMNRQKVQNGTIIQCWCWSFNTIKENLPDIARAGFKAIQTSPINACREGDEKGMALMSNTRTGGKWYYHYQPIAWKIGNYQLGTREEFKAMCEEAEKYGISVIVDVLPNHTSSYLPDVLPEFIEAVGGMDKLLHENGRRPIKNWSNRYEGTTGQMGGLPDVNTENPLFQEYFMDYMNDTILCGADGFRFDTAKHIGLPDDPRDDYSKDNDFWPIFTGKKAINGKMLSRADELFLYGEVLQGGNAREKEYTEFVSVTASNYGGNLRRALSQKRLSAAALSDFNHPANPDKLVTWVESHDTYANQGESAKMTHFQLRAGWAIITARQYGTPLFFSRPQGPEATQFPGVSQIGDKGNNEFMHPEVVAVNKFRNAMIGLDEKLSNGSTYETLIIERGNKGVVIVNIKEGTENINHKVSLADGEYIDHANGIKFKVKDGILSGKIKAKKIAVIY